MNLLDARDSKLVMAILCIAFFATDADGLGFEAFGPAQEHIGISPDWPKGAEELLKHPSRVYWQEVNGNDHSYFDGDIDQVNELLDLFAKMDLKRHGVILKHGRPSAKSFAGKLTPYTVEFELPSGIYLYHAKENVKTGLYGTNPRLHIHVAKEWVTELPKLTIPVNIQLRAEAYRAEQLLKGSQDEDRSIRSRALRLLGQCTTVSDDAMASLEKATKSDDQYVKAASTAALEAIKSASTPESTDLRDQVLKYLDHHPQRYRVPTADELLKSLKQIDQKYAKENFTARGTLVESSGQRLKWVITMGNEKLVIRKTAVGEQATGTIEHTIFASPDRMGTIQRLQYWVQGKLIQSKPFTSMEPVGNTYDLLIGRLMWPIGRGFTRRIDRIEKVAERPDGTLDVVAFGENNLGIRWELNIDPTADYLVRRAMGFRTRRDNGKAEYIVDAAGVFERDGRFTNHTARWLAGEDAEPISIAVESVSSKPDIDLVFEIEDAIIDANVEAK